MEDDPLWHSAEAKDEDAGETSNYNVGQECLDRLSIALGGNTIVPVASEQLQVYLSAAEWEKHHAALIALAQIAEGCSKVRIYINELTLSCDLMHLIVTVDHVFPMCSSSCFAALRKYCRVDCSCLILKIVVDKVVVNLWCSLSALCVIFGSCVIVDKFSVLSVLGHHMHLIISVSPFKSMCSKSNVDMSFTTIIISVFVLTLHFIELCIMLHHLFIHWLLNFVSLFCGVC